MPDVLTATDRVPGFRDEQRLYVRSRPADRMVQATGSCRQGGFDPWSPGEKTGSVVAGRSEKHRDRLVIVNTVLWGAVVLDTAGSRLR